MKKHVLITTALLILVSNTIAEAQWRSKTHDVYNALMIPPGVDIKVGDFSEYWEGVFETVSGWYTHAIVFGKNSEHTGLVVLTNEVLAVEAVNKLATTWGILKSVR